MQIESLKIPGTYLIENNIHIDDRGSFENLYNLELLEKLETNFAIRQVNLSRNQNAGTVRGLHYQRSPAPESKIVNCVLGLVFDVMVDLRIKSEFFGCWQSVILKPSQNAVYIPDGVAHGFQTLTDNCIIQYLHSGNYVPSLSTGIRFDDPNLQISWPQEVSEVSENDIKLPLLEEIRNKL